jgi:sec-independent protein translocase protein TatB
MPSFGDSAFIFILALLLFGPKKLPELARQLGKLMAEFRRASNEFRQQMDEELRLADQAEQQKKIAAMEAAAPATPSIADTIPEPEHPHTQPIYSESSESAEPSESVTAEAVPAEAVSNEATPEPLPIATSGDLSMMPPATGLPIPRSSESVNNTIAENTGNEALAPILQTIPHDPESQHQGSDSHSETPIHG